MILPAVAKSASVASNKLRAMPLSVTVPVLLANEIAEMVGAVVSASAIAELIGNAELAVPMRATNIRT
ncbi:MAG: hypothetical protein UX49_C0037G0005 [Candidatus Wolfebacteria bacterium GW2011_GWC2_46_275]|nr:MAG: hypothetical protein UX49_C0037G0005 [Candidatus Wolfebacteria bacterium GW2011_GWC2_46_275]KKU70787.1 MAG: hypothetical protein UX96_C0037G0008 [Candidatus Wolfebacteria bacterium GW2011_GWB1_47_243]